MTRRSDQAKLKAYRAMIASLDAMRATIKRRAHFLKYAERHELQGQIILTSSHTEVTLTDLSDQLARDKQTFTDALAVYEKLEQL